MCTKTYFDQHNANADHEFFPRGSLISTDWGGISASFPSWLDFLGEEIKRPTHTVASSYAALSMAQAGLGVALVQKLYAAEPLRRGQLVLASLKLLNDAELLRVSAACNFDTTIDRSIRELAYNMSPNRYRDPSRSYNQRNPIKLTRHARSNYHTVHRTQCSFIHSICVRPVRSPNSERVVLNHTIE